MRERGPTKRFIDEGTQGRASLLDTTRHASSSSLVPSQPAANVRPLLQCRRTLHTSQSLHITMRGVSLLISWFNRPGVGQRSRTQHNLYAWGLGALLRELLFPYFHIFLHAVFLRSPGTSLGPRQARWMPVPCLCPWPLRDTNRRPGFIERLHSPPHAGSPGSDDRSSSSLILWGYGPGHTAWAPFPHWLYKAQYPRINKMLPKRVLPVLFLVLSFSFHPGSISLWYPSSQHVPDRLRGVFHPPSGNLQPLLLIGRLAAADGGAGGSRVPP